MLLSDLLSVIKSNVLIKIINVGEYIPTSELMFEGYVKELFTDIELYNKLNYFTPCSIKPVEEKIEISVY